MAYRKLGRTSSHRAAMFRNQLASLIESERIITTLPKAKELRPLIEKLITLARTDSVHARRQAARSIPDDALIAKLFDIIGPRFAERPGGYTRIMKLGARRGDAAEMAILELVERSPEKTEAKDTEKETPAKGAKKKAASKKAAPADEEPSEEKPKRAKKPAAPKKEAPAKKKEAAKPKPAKKKKAE